MAGNHYVIIGNGAAGNKAAETLRKGDPEGRITVISAEPVHFIHRHRLAGFLAEEANIADLAVHPPSWYEELNLRLRLNQPVERVDFEDKSILLAHRERIKYDKLLICSGAKHRIPEYLSHFEKLLTKFSNGKHAIELKSMMPGIKRVTILGGDAIGLQLLNAFLPAGKDVTMIMDEYRFWPLESDAGSMDRLARALEAKGVKVVRNDHVTEVEKRGETKVVSTRGGVKVESDVVLVCSGMVPCLDFLADSGIDTQMGVLVDDKLRASVEDVWAAGECAQMYYEEIKDYRCQTGYQNAVRKGEKAALNALGADESAKLCEPGKLVVGGEEFITYGWKGFTLDETS